MSLLIVESDEPAFDTVERNPSSGIGEYAMPRVEVIIQRRIESFEDDHLILLQIRKIVLFVIGVEIDPARDEFVRWGVASAEFHGH